MKKVGLITLFHKNYNYGGALQGYALNRYLNGQGFDAATILYEEPKWTTKEKIKRYCSLNGWFKTLFFCGKVAFLKARRKFHRWLNRENQEKIQGSLDERKRRYEELIGGMVVTKKVYSDSTLYELNDFLDGYVVGSDQVWNATFSMPLSSFFWLNFPSEGKGKVAYAASFGSAFYNPVHTAFMRRQLSSFHYISVREESGVKIAAETSGRQAQLVADPVFLLDEKEWSALIELENVSKPKEKYAFVYLLGHRKKYIRMVEKYCMEHDLRLVNIPFLHLRYDKAELYGDTMDIAAGPWEFLSYIKHAEIVFTDSFHACAFSWIFKRKCVAFRRHRDGARDSMNARLESFVRQVGEEKALLEYNVSYKQMDRIAKEIKPIHSENGAFEQFIQASKYYLHESLR